MQIRLWEAQVRAWAAWWPGKYDSLNATGSASVVLTCLCSRKRPGAFSGTCAWPVTLCCCGLAQQASPAPHGLRGPWWAMRGHLFPWPGGGRVQHHGSLGWQCREPWAGGAGVLLHRPLCSMWHGGSGSDLGATFWPSWYLLESGWEL